MPYIPLPLNNRRDKPTDRTMIPIQTTSRLAKFPSSRPLVGGLLVVVVAGWSVSPSIASSPEIASHRARLELTSVPHEPAQVLSLLKRLKTQPKQANPPQLAEVIVAGQIGGMPNPWSDSHPNFPWFAGQASFFLVDSKVAGQFAHHAKNHGGSTNCAFCQRLAEKNAHAVAVVNLIGDDGKIVPIDSRELFPLREGQSVVVRGRAELLGGTMLVIHADGIHVRR
jgi:hypothetical protein